MTTQSRLPRILLLVLILALGVAACGGDDQKEADKSTSNGSSTSSEPYKTVTATDAFELITAKIAATYPDLTETDDTDFNINLTGLTLSPDGTKLLAFLEKRADEVSNHTCLYLLADESLNCRPYMSSLARVRSWLDSLIAWAPDNNHLVTHTEWMMFADDPDLILVEADSGTGVTITEDGYFGNIFGDTDEAFNMDYAPFWAPDSQSVYFFRVARPTEDYWGDHVQLMNIKLDGGAITTVADLSGKLNGPTFGQPTDVALSPDGKEIVIVTNNFGGEENPLNIWRVNLTSGEAELWLDYQALLKAATPTWSEDPTLFGLDIVWSADGRYVVVSLESQMHLAYSSNLDEVPPLTYLVIDAESGAVRSLVDMSQFATAEAYAEMGGFMKFSPIMGMVSPDGQLIYATVESGEGDTRPITFWSAPLTLDADAVEIATLDLATRLLSSQGRLGHDTVLGKVAPNGAALVQLPMPPQPGGVYLLQFGR